jgi:hypothetical protein
MRVERPPRLSSLSAAALRGYTRPWCRVFFVENAKMTSATHRLEPRNLPVEQGIQIAVGRGHNMIEDSPPAATKTRCYIGLT